MEQQSIIEYWPMKEFAPRKTQEEVLYWMETLPSEIKYIICQIPVGGGKSPLGINLSGYLDNSKGNSFILTPQKVLQKQYQDSFDKSTIFSLYGKSNYKCESKDTNCDIGSDIKPRCTNCPYRNAMGEAKGSPNLVLNYTLAFLLFMLKEEVGLTKRKLIIFDECHTLEHHLTEFKSLQIGEKRCRQFKVPFFLPKTIFDAIEWMKNTYHPAVKNEYLQLKTIVDAILDRYENGESMDKADADSINKLKDIVQHLDTINEYITMSDEKINSDYVLIKDKSFFKFKPLYGKELFNQYVKPMAERFLFMSSTVLDKNAYCNDLGIPANEAAFISVDSEFDIDNRPVVYCPVMKMTQGWDSFEKRAERQQMIKSIIQICDSHNEDSGIMHTGSFQIADWLIKELNGKIPHRILHHNPDSDKTRDEIIDEFISNNNNEPYVLISPSITEGLDLKDDKGRFAIIVKVPYPYLGDAWVKRRQELSREWYSRQAMIGIIQGSGRVVRSKTDWGYTYILDESFGGLLKMYSKNVPKWFKDSIS